MCTRGSQSRRGSVAVLAMFLMVILLGFIVFAVDVGYLYCVNTELQRTADAAAIAATWKLVEQEQLGNAVNTDTLTTVSDAANQYASLNKVANANITIASSDIDIGELPYPFSSASTMTYTTPSLYNAVKVRIRKNSDSSGNGSVPLFFARVLGMESCDMQREATAAFLNNFGGFRALEGDQKLQILPFALDKKTWDDMLAGVGNDNYRWDCDAKTVKCGSDGILEVNLYPQGTGSPGNRGTVDIGPSNNSTADLSRQIRHGISKADLDAIGGKLEFDATGKLSLNGDTGISAGVKDDLASIIGQTRIIPIFETVTGPGNNAQYTIVQFAGVRILYVKLTGSPSSKQVMIQPACVISRGAIPAAGAPASRFVYSPVWLVR